MNNRKSFLRTTFLGFLGTTIVSAPKFAFANRLNGGGIVREAGEGEVYFVRENTAITIKVSGKTDHINSVSICTEEILPGNGISIHKHLNEDEIFFFHAGNGTFFIDEKEIAVTAGSTAFVPRGTWHGFKNTGTELAVFTFGYTPSGFEDFFRQIGTVKGIPFKAKSQEEFTRLATKYGIVYK